MSSGTVTCRFKLKRERGREGIEKGLRGRKSAPNKQYKTNQWARELLLLLRRIPPAPAIKILTLDERKGARKRRGERDRAVRTERGRGGGEKGYPNTDDFAKQRRCLLLVVCWLHIADRPSSMHSPNYTC